MKSNTTKMPAAQPSYRQATGKMPYSLTNDYLFRALLQRNNRVLKHLICALLHLRPEEVSTATIENPIVLGKALDNKTFILDIQVLLNNQALINLEMQVVNYLNWTERSLSYLCRSFDQLQKGQDYQEVKPVIHIGFLDFTLFSEYPEFYATYKLINVKNHHIFTDKFVISVVDLNQIGMATEEDRQWEIDYWAALFKATTWEEVKMLAEQNPVFEDAVKTMYEMSAEEEIRQQCWAREDYYRTINTYEAYLRNSEQKIEQQAGEIERQAGKIEQQAGKIERQAGKIEQQAGEIERQAGEIEQQADKIEQQAGEIERQADKIEQQAGEIEQQADKIEQQAGEIEQQAGEIEQQAGKIEWLANKIEQLESELQRLKVLLPDS